MKPEQTEALSTLLDYLEDEIRYYEQSRLLHLPPAERSRRIRLRKAWIASIKALAQEIEAKQ
jgi:hypothetical protein